AVGGRQGRTCVLGVVLAIAIVSIWTPFMSESIAARWFTWPNIALLAPVPVATAAVAWLTWRALDNDAQATPFLGAIGLFVLSYIGIAISLFPMIVPYHFTLWQAAASERTQAFLLIGTLALLPVILMYTGWSYWVFRGKVRSDMGYDEIDHSHIEPKRRSMSAMSEETRPIEEATVAGESRAARKRVVIIGAGFAGLAAAHALRHAEADVL